MGYFGGGFGGNCRSQKSRLSSSQEETDDDKFVEETIINTKQQRGQGEKESERVWCECALASFERDSQQKKSGCFCEKS